MARCKFRKSSTYRRRAPTREPYDVVMIICEGEKTEPNYFRGLRSAYRLSSTNIMIAPHDAGTDPLNLVRYAEAELERDPEITRAYCVFDRDGHANYEQALRQVQQSQFGRSERLFAVESVPCFELWVLLHFRYSAAPFVAAGGSSPCDCVIRALKEFLPDYTKATEAIFETLHPRISTGLENARRLATENANCGATNPGTRVHELVDYLLKLKGT